MKEYERLTKKDQDWFEFTEISDNEIYKRLQELENKIEDGKLVELPCIYKTNLLAEYEVAFFNKEYNCIDGFTFSTKAEAEAKLKELQGK